MYQLKPLPFHYQDLEPFIDTHTIGLHYWKHQKKYLDQLNRILEKNLFSFSYPIEDIYQHIKSFREEDQNDILFYLGGVLNHNLYFASISPKQKENPQGSLKKAIAEKFGSFEEFKQKWTEYALDLKGSGYVFLVRTKKNQIEVITTQNQDNPILYHYVPLFCMDMWEHAYYLTYKNDKRKYIENFFEIANFKEANQRFEENI